MKEKKFIRMGIHLPVNEVKATVEWYVQHLDFMEPWYYGDPVTDGGCRRDDLRLLFGKHDGTLQTPKEINLLFFVSNIEAVYEEFQQKQISIARALQQYDYDMKEFTIADLNGYYIRISEPVE